MIKRLVIVIIALVLVFGGIFGWKYYAGQQAAKMHSQPQPPATISATQVQVEAWQPYLHSVGSLTATQGVFVSNEVAGQVQKIRFESGQQVKQGEVLLQLDDSVDQAELQGLIAERRLAEVQFNRTAKLIKQKSISRSDYDAAQAQLQSAKANVASKRAVIEKKSIQAPFSGVLGIRQVDVGQYLAAGSQIVSLQQLDPIYVDYAVPERQMAQVSTGQPVRVNVQGYKDQVFEGKISAINARVDSATRMVTVRATLANPDGKLRPGMFAEVRSVLPQQTGVLTLPRTAITYAPYGDSVFVIEHKQGGGLVVQRKQVQTGTTRGDRVQILSGLQAGTQVVSAGQVKLRNGQSVRIDNSVALDGGQDSAQ